MKISIKNKITPSLNMVSMTDIVFLLLIFLLITVQQQPTSIPVDLPLSSNSKATTAPIHVTVTASLQYYVDDQKVLFDQLYPILQTKLANNTHKNIILHMDKQLSIANMVKVADIANKLGASVSLATKFNQTP